MSEGEAQLREEAPIGVENLVAESMEACEVRDREALEELIQGYKERIDDLVQQIYELRQIHEETLRRNRELQIKFAEDSKQLEAEVALLAETLLAQKARFQEQFAKSKDKKDLRLNDLNEQKRGELIALQKEVERLSGEYMDLKDVEERKTKLLQEIGRLEVSYVQAQYDHHDRLNKEDKKFAKQRINVENINSNSLKEIRRTAAKQAEESVAREKQDDQERNDRLKLTLRKLEDKLAKLKVERTEHIAQSRQFFLNQSLLVEEQQEYKANLSRLAGQATQLRARIAFFKEELGRQSTLHKKRMGEAAEEEARQEQQLRRTLQQRRGQLSRVADQMARTKRLSDVLLRQKELIEQFFKTGLEQLRSGISAGRERRREQLPPIRGERVDISELDLENKEKILRIIYGRVLGNKRK